MERKTKNNNIAVICDDLTEFFVIRDVVDRMIKMRMAVDIIVPYDSGYNGLPEHTLKSIQKLGYSPLRDAPKNKTYKILLTPYPGLDVVKRLDFIYHIRYPYGALSAKPNPAYSPDIKIDYDAIVSFNTYEPEFFGAYGAKVFAVPYWRYSDFKKLPKTSTKPVLCILPTFGADTSCINMFTESSIKDLKEHFFVLAKAHHATHFGIDGDAATSVLEKLADKYYDSDTPIDQLLKKSDLVLSDNSGSIFEALCAGVPVALMAKELNIRRFESIDTLQYTLVKNGIIPHTDNTEGLMPMLLSINKYKKKQDKISKELFLRTKKDPYEAFINIIKFYLSKDSSQDYYKILHDSMVREWRNDKQKIFDQEKEIASLKQNISDFYNSTSWKITKPLRAISSRSKKHDKK